MIRAILKLPWYYVRRRMIASWTIDFTGFSEEDLDNDATGIVVGKMHARKPSRVLKLHGNKSTYRASVSPDEALAPLFALRFFRHCDLLGAEPNLAEEAAELLFDLSVAGFQSTGLPRCFSPRSLTQTNRIERVCRPALQALRSRANLQDPRRVGVGLLPPGNRRAFKTRSARPGVAGEDSRSPRIQLLHLRITQKVEGAEGCWR